MDLKNTGISKTARIYFRVSTDEQNLERQHHLIERAKAQGFYITGIYSEKASGVNPDRSELRRLINDLQTGDWVIAESIDRITRLPPAEAERLIDEITAKGAKIQVPEIFDFEELGVLFEQDGSLPGYLLQPLLAALQKMFLRIAFIKLHLQGFSITQTAQTLGCSVSTVNRVSRQHKKRTGTLDENQPSIFRQPAQR